MDNAPLRAGIVAFGRFRILPHCRELLVDGQSIKLGGRAFDVLMALIEARGAILSKDQLLERVWPGRIVEENNLQAQISVLRAAFGPERGLIRTVSGRGYQFAGEIRVLGESLDGRVVVRQASPDMVRPPTNLPEPVSELIGREEALREVLRLTAAHRIVTLTGPGGIGKTRLSLAVGHLLLPDFTDGAWIVELAPLANPSLVPARVAASVRVELPGGAVSAERVASALSTKRLLIVLDNCEHVIDAAATMAEALLRADPTARIIATSREPLRVEGEWVYQVPPLAVPEEGAQDDPLQYGAVQLFLERARAADPHFLRDRHLATVTAAICRRLDGIPLAVELAAARVTALGIDELASRLDDRFHLLTGGRRTALPRHQTLRATFDWSYTLLAESERIVLRRLSAFAGAFRFEAASMVVADAEIATENDADAIFSLVSKSLVVAEIDGPVARYRLLETTRAYGQEKLDESGERQTVARRHAEYYRALFEQAEAEWEARPTTEWLADYAWQIDNLRIALDWAFSPNGDASIGIALTTAAVPLWMHLSLPEECRGRAEQALATLMSAADGDLRREMKLTAAVGASLAVTRGAAAPEAATVWTRALEIADMLHDADYQSRALWGLWNFRIANGQPEALALAQRFNALAAARFDRYDQLIGELMIGIAQHFLGSQPAARCHLERMLANYVAPENKSQVVRFQVDPQVRARVFLAWSLWVEGLPEQAMEAAESSIEDAKASAHALSLAYAMTLAACPIALLLGDLASAERYVDVLLEQSTRHALRLWGAFGDCVQGVLLITRGDAATGLGLLRAGFAELGAAGSVRFIRFQVAEALGRAGAIEEGLALAGDAITYTERSGERWLTAELLRVRGELLLTQNAAGAAAVAEDHFRHALAWAGGQGALSWELRAAMSLARLLRGQGRLADAAAILRPVYERFTEGFGTSDLIAARALLDALG